MSNDLLTPSDTVQQITHTDEVPLSPIDELISRYKSDDTVDVEVAEMRFRFRVVRDRADLNRMKRAGVRILKLKPESVPNVGDREYYDTDDETKIWAYILSDCSVDPKLTVTDLLKLAKRAAFAFEAISSQWNAAYLTGEAQAEDEGIDASKND